MTTLRTALLLAGAMVVALLASRRLSVEPFPSAGRRALALALLILTLALACVAPLVEFPEADPDREGPAAFGAFFLGHGLLASFLLAWWWLAGRPQPGAYLHLGRTGLRDGLRLGAAAGAAGWAVALTTMAIAASLAAEVEPGGLAGAGEVPAVVRAIVDLAWERRLLLVLSAGIVEEAFFRAFLQARVGLLVSSLLFTTSHMTYGLPLMLVGVFAVSIVFGLLFRMRRDVLPSMVAHCVFDGIQLFLILPAVVAGS